MKKSVLKLGVSLLMLAAAGAAWAQDRVKLVTSMGDIVVELDAAKAPKTVANFKQYVSDKHYDGTIFHRVIDGFMVQGGGMDAQMQERKTRAPVELEAGNGLLNDRGTIAMARTNDPNSATSQFFINLVDNGFLNASPSNPGYTVFGKVVQGMDVVDKIRKVATGNSGMHQNVPTQAVVLQSATLLNDKAPAKANSKKAASKAAPKAASKAVKK